MRANKCTETNPRANAHNLDNKDTLVVFSPFHGSPSLSVSLPPHPSTCCSPCTVHAYAFAVPIERKSRPGAFVTVIYGCRFIFSEQTCMQQTKSFSANREPKKSKNIVPNNKNGAQDKHLRLRFYTPVICLLPDKELFKRI